ncbi:MAG: ComF family protein [Pirellulales bacterium]|nr:ComF family protein [Pirellulales bacterium]
MIGLLRDLQNGVRALRRAGFDLLFPPRCAFCHVELIDPPPDFDLCPDCEIRFGPEEWIGCPRCGAPRNADYSIDDCPSCQNLQLWFDSVVALGNYHAELRDAVLKMKRPWHDPLSVAMGWLLWKRRRAELARVQADAIVPVPMYWRRRLKRGKNHSETLARCLAKSLGVPVCWNVLTRRRNTQLHSGLSRAQRFRNVRGAFQVKRPERVRDMRILLVDDVLTTGATCSEAAKTLKRAGAATVAVAVVARA